MISVTSMTATCRRARLAARQVQPPVRRASYRTYQRFNRLISASSVNADTFWRRTGFHTL